MQLYKRKGVYQVSYQSSDGHQIRRSLKTREKRIATQCVASLELELHEAKLFGKEPDRSFKELMITYLEAKRRTKGYSRLQSGAKPLLAFFGDSKLGEIKPSSVEKYVGYRSEGVKDGTIKRETGILSAAFNHVIKKHGWKVENPCIAADLPSEPKGRVRFITRPEALRLFQAARYPVMQNGKPVSERNKSPALADFIELALNTGCRKQELLGLRWTDVDLTHRLLCLEETKAGVWQTVPINDEARALLVKRMRRRDEICPESPFVFFHEAERAGAKIGDRVLDLKKSFKRACSQAGINDFRIHDLRHTFASWLVMDGVPLYDVSKLLRHSNIRMTEKYAHLAPDHLQKAIAGRGFSAHFQHTSNLLKAVV